MARSRGTSHGETDDLGRPLAEWWQRLVAVLVDAVVVSLPLYVLFAGIVGIGASEASLVFNETTGQFETRGLGGAAAGMILGALVMIVGPFVYQVALNGSERGQTVGKMVMKIAVRDEESACAIGYSRALHRQAVYNGLFVLLYVPGFINGLSPLWDPKRQGWHDKVARSVVVEAEN